MDMAEWRCTLIVLLYLTIASFIPTSLSADEVPKIDGAPCQSEIFCHGPLLKAAQLSNIFKDSKDFVDRPLKADADNALKEFQKLNYDYRRGPAEKLGTFLDQYFAPVGSDVEVAIPVDWKEPGKHIKRQLWTGIDLLLSKIKDRGLAQWTVDLHSKWPELTRKTTNAVLQHPERHSLIHLPHPFIVHGPEPSRYREQHYWESYFIVHGLLISGMHATAKGMILNLAHLIDRFGHIPLANRAYYQERSHPPLLSAMVNLYWLHQSADHPQDGLNLIKAVLPAVQREYDFWMKERAVDVKLDNGQTFKLSRYQGTVTKPRPEGYREDHEASRSLRNRTVPGVEDKFHANIAAASESGWEFSSRWLDQPGKSQLSEIRTQDIIPVDLNAFLCQTERHLAFFYNQIGDKEKNIEYERKSEGRGDAIHAVFWNDSLNMWRDFDMKHNRQRLDFYLSSMTPLFASCSPKNNLYTQTDFLRRVAASQDVQKLVSYPGGLPVSFVDALGACHSCQWDFPNSWPTAALYLIEPFAKSDQEEFRAMAKNWAQKVVSSVHNALEQGVEISEKYDVREGQTPYGKGGEYAVQKGFAPTIGALLRFIELFPADLRVMESENNEVLEPAPTRLTKVEVPPDQEDSLTSTEIIRKQFHDVYEENRLKSSLQRDAAGPSPSARSADDDVPTKAAQAGARLQNPETKVEGQRIGSSESVTPASTPRTFSKQAKSAPTFSDRNCQSFNAAFSFPALLSLVILANTFLI